MKEKLLSSDKKISGLIFCHMLKQCRVEDVNFDSGNQSGAPNKDIVRNHLDITLLNVF